MPDAHRETGYGRARTTHDISRGADAGSSCSGDTRPLDAGPGLAFTRALRHHHDVASTKSFIGRSGTRAEQRALLGLLILPAMDLWTVIVAAGISIFPLPFSVDRFQSFAHLAFTFCWFSNFWLGSNFL